MNISTSRVSIFLIVSQLLTLGDSFHVPLHFSLKSPNSRKRSLSNLPRNTFPNVKSTSTGLLEMSSVAMDGGKRRNIIHRRLLFRSMVWGDKKPQELSPATENLEREVSAIVNERVLTDAMYLPHQSKRLITEERDAKFDSLITVCGSAAMISTFILICSHVASHQTQ